MTAALLQSLRAEQPTPLPRSRLAAVETAPEVPAVETGQPGSAPASGQEAARGAALATAAGSTPDGTADDPGTAATPVDLEAAAPADGWGTLGSDERAAPAPIPPLAPEAGETAQPPAPAVSLVTFSDDADATGRPLAPGDRIRLAVGNKGADIIEREIGPDGQLALPGGLTVAAGGLTLPELKRAITVKLVESYLESLSVEVSRSGGAAGNGAASGPQAPQ